MHLSKEQVFSREEIRNFDRRAIEKFGIPSIVLMENAGRSVAEYLLSLSPQGPILIVCGKGNNGGDGFVIARHLMIHTLPVRILLVAQPDELSNDAKINYNIANTLQIPIIHFHQKINEEFMQADWIVDGLFGTGLRGMVQPPYDELIHKINASTAKILAIDIPSGLDCDTGKPLGTAIKAQHTVTFVGYKRGFLNPEACPYLGQVHVVNIGISPTIF